MDTINLQSLKSNIFRRYGKVVNYYFECEQLSQHIQLCTKEYISPQTLRRVLGFIQSTSKPSKRTLQILSTYCGFDSLNALNDQVISKDYIVKNQALNDIIKEFYNIDINPVNDINYQKACGNIAKKLIQDLNLLASLDSYLCKNNIAQVYFFERFPYIDGLRNQYLNSFKKYSQQKKSNEATLFSQSLLFLAAFLGNDEKKMAFHLNLINKVDDLNVHPFPIARKVASNILYSWIKNKEVDLKHWKDKAFILEKKMPRKTSLGAQFPYFQYIMIECFNLISDDQSALKMLEIVEIDYKIRNDNNIEHGYYECLDASKAFAYILAGNYNIARRLLDKIEPHNFIFISQKYYLLFYKIVELKLCKSQTSNKFQNITDEIEVLIAETDFVYFKRFL